MKKTLLMLLIVSVAFLGICLHPAIAKPVPTIAEIIAEIDKTLEDRLNLTPGQRATIETELTKQKNERKTLANQEELKVAAIEAEMIKPVVNKALVETLTNELNTIRGNVISLKANTAQKIKDVLTVDQIVILQDIKADQIKKLNPPVVVAETATIEFYSIECSHRGHLPDWYFNDPGTITKTLLDDLVKDQGCCHYISGWALQYGDQNATIVPSDTMGLVAGYTPSGPTDGANGVKVENIDLTGITDFRVRAVWQPGYYKFSESYTDGDSSEFYCHDDIYGFNNKEVIYTPVDGGTYTCVLITDAD